MSPIISAFAAVLLLSKPLTAHSTQRPLKQESASFIDNSIFRQHPDLLESLADPDQHVYDDFTDDIPYQGIATFAHLNTSNCFSASSDGMFDIGIVGAPFDLGVSYRPGARFGPAGTRMGSRRLAPSMAYR
jgi:agmatinase